MIAAVRPPCTVAGKPHTSLQGRGRGPWGLHQHGSTGAQAQPFGVAHMRQGQLGEHGA